MIFHILTKVAAAQRKYPNANTLNIAAYVAGQEHQRMVRAVHRLKRIVDSPDGNYNLGYRRACLDVLAALERGRGKGGK